MCFLFIVQDYIKKESRPFILWTSILLTSDFTDKSLILQTAAILSII